MTMTTTTTTETMTMTMTSSAAESAARELEARSGEGPSGPPPRAHGGRRKGSGRKPKTGAKKAAPVVEPITEEEIQAFSFLGGTVWDLAAGVFKMERLSDEERDRLGAAMAPVARKYLPSLEEYAPETGLVICVAGLVVAKRKRAPKPEPDADMEINPNGQEAAA